jgi:hypothetical protein
VEVFAWIHGIGVQNAGKLDLKLDSAILVEDPIDAVLVVCGGKDVANDELAGTRYGYGIVTEICVLEENTVIFFVDADGIFDGCGCTGTIHKGCIQVVDCAFAIAA